MNRQSIVIAEPQEDQALKKAEPKVDILMDDLSVFSEP